MVPPAQRSFRTDLLDRIHAPLVPSAAMARQFPEGFVWGTATAAKEADIILLDATALNVAPLTNVPEAVVSLMDRTNVETVIVAGKVREWKGRRLGVHLNHLRRQLEASRDLNAESCRGSEGDEPIPG
jgi:hypothetical protein